MLVEKRHRVLFAGLAKVAVVAAVAVEVAVVEVVGVAKSEVVSTETMFNNTSKHTAAFLPSSPPCIVHLSLDMVLHGHGNSGT